MKNIKLFLLICIILSFFSGVIFALNPFITHIYTADPSAHVFENRVYVYPSHDKDDADWFDMEDYHVFSSADMKNWVDHGVVFSYKSLLHNPYTNSYGWIGGPDPSGDSGIYDMHPRLWAPDCAYNNGTYYLYYCARVKTIQSEPDSDGYWPKHQFKIGVATSKSPCGPFIPVEYVFAQDPDGNYIDPETGLYYHGQMYIPGSFSIDPCVFVDDDGKVVMIFGGQSYGGLKRGQEGPYFAELNTDNPDDPTTFMVTFATKPVEMFSSNGDRISDWFEGSWLHKRNGIYYLSYPDDMKDHENHSEIRYATNDFLSPFNWRKRGTLIPVVSDNFEPAGTNHHSIVEFKGVWYAFYHNSNLIGDDMKRSICVDKAYYNRDGTMKQVIPTRAGTGTSAYTRIKAQFYSSMSGVETEPCGGGDIGRRVCYIHNNDYLHYQEVDFGSIGANSFEACVASNNIGGTIEIWIYQGTMSMKIGEVVVGNTGGWGNDKEDWIIVNGDLIDTLYGVYHVRLIFKGSFRLGLMNLNWFRFKPKQNIPVGHSVALKSLNPFCIDNNGDMGPEKYLCVDDNYSKNLCANRPSVAGAWEKFSVLTYYYNNNTIQLNSSNNGNNLYAPNDSNIPVRASGGSFRGVFSQDLLYWVPNDDGTISFRSYQSNKYYCVDTINYNNDPARVYANKDGVYGSFEKFYVEVADAPIGCVVGFKSKGDTDSTPYLGAKSTSDYTIEATKINVSTDYRKFLVVDAGNGFVAFKMLANNKYISISNGMAMADSDTITNYTKFQWINNGNGTISLECAQFPSYYLSKSSSTDTIACNYYSNYWETNDLARFYCHIVK